MAMNPRQLVLVSCRHCLRPIMLGGEIADLELAPLQDHLSDCVAPQAARPPAERR